MQVFYFFWGGGFSLLKFNNSSPENNPVFEW